VNVSDTECICTSVSNRWTHTNGVCMLNVGLLVHPPTKPGPRSPMTPSRSPGTRLPAALSNQQITSVRPADRQRLFCLDDIFSRARTAIRALVLVQWDKMKYSRGCWPQLLLHNLNFSVVVVVAVVVLVVVVVVVVADTVYSCSYTIVGPMQLLRLGLRHRK